jgi:hypothetical protein
MPDVHGGGFGGLNLVASRFTFLEESLGRDRLIPDVNVRGKSEKSLHSDF